MNLYSPQFEPLPLPGAEIHYCPAFLDISTAARLFDALVADTPWRQDRLRIAGRQIPVPRLQAWYGDAGSGYAYSGLRLNPLPWTLTLNQLRGRIEQALGLHFNSVLLNYYRDGNDSVSWHSDDEPELGPDPLIASLSLGAARRFELKPLAGGDKRHLLLENGSLLLMGSGLQRNWRHCLPKQPGLPAARLNLTFRLVYPMA